MPSRCYAFVSRQQRAHLVETFVCWKLKHVKDENFVLSCQRSIGRGCGKGGSATRHALQLNDESQHLGALSMACLIVEDCSLYLYHMGKVNDIKGFICVPHG